MGAEPQRAEKRDGLVDRKRGRPGWEGGRQGRPDGAPAQLWGRAGERGV